MQYTQIDRAEVARCTLSVSCSTDLDCCVADDRVGVFLEHVHRTLKASERFTPDFPSFFFILLAFWLPQQAPEPLQYLLKIWIDHWPAGFKISRHVKTSGQFSDSCSCGLRTKVFANTILEHYSQTMVTKTVRILRTVFNFLIRFKERNKMCRQTCRKF